MSPTNHTPPSDTEEVQKTFQIITHMNKAHKSSLSRYLRHIHHLSAISASQNPTLTCIQKSSLTITIDSLWKSIPWANFKSKRWQTYYIPLDPPLQDDLNDIRPRLIAMDADAKTALGISDIIIERYTAPENILERLNILIICFTFLMFPLPRSFFNVFIGSFVPEGFAGFLLAVSPYVWWFMVLVHSGETIYFVKSPMMRHDVPVLSKNWWKWVGSTMVEGVGAQWRFGRLVEGERRRVERKKMEGGH